MAESESSGRTSETRFHSHTTIHFLASMLCYQQYLHTSINIDIQPKTAIIKTVWWTDWWTEYGDAKEYRSEKCQAGQAP